MRIFSLDDRYNCLRTLDLNKYFAQHLVLEKEDNVESQEEPGQAVIGLYYNCHSKNEETPKEDYHITRYTIPTYIHIQRPAKRRGRLGGRGNLSPSSKGAPLAGMEPPGADCIKK